MQNPCKDCIYYHKENRTCQSKKCATGGSGKVSWIDKLFCSPCKKDGRWYRWMNIKSGILRA